MGDCLFLFSPSFSCTAHMVREKEDRTVWRCGYTGGTMLSAGCLLAGNVALCSETDGHRRPTKQFCALLLYR